jgi:SAM-dependent methyltransferase
MVSQVSVADSFAAVVCCPHCRAPLPGGTCERCRTVCRVEGPVVNFLGDGGIRMPARNDVALANWLLANRARVGDALSELKVARVRNGHAATPVSTALVPDGAVTPADVAHMLDSGPFCQILNDLKRFAEGISTPSETVAFMLAHSDIGPESTVLDAGCSCGRHMWELSGKGPGLLVGVDVHLLALAVGALAWQAHAMPSMPRWCCASVLQLPFRDGSFTQVNSFVTLSGVPVRAGLSELTRVLAPGGRLLFTVEGMGYWQSCWDGARPFSIQRMQLLRWWLGDRLLEAGLDWQRHPVSRRLAGLTQFVPKTIRRLVEEAGLVIEQQEVLRRYRGRPSLLGLLARKPNGEAVGRGNGDNSREARTVLCTTRPLPFSDNG